jgi:hypothetical protein
MRQSRHFPKVNQRNKFGHNHGVSARNDFADNPCALTLEYGKRGARASCPRQASDLHLSILRPSTPEEYAGFGL